MRGEKVLRVTISLINGYLGLMGPTHHFTPADGGKARVHWFSATSPDLAFSDAAFGPDAPDRNGRGETTQGSEEVTLRSEGTADFGKLFLDVDPTSPPPSVGWQSGRFHYCVRYPPGPPSPSDFGPQTV